MYNLMNEVVRRLEPQASERMADRFNLSKDRAEQVLPVVVSVVLVQVKHVLENPDKHPDLVHAFLAEEDYEEADEQRALGTVLLADRFGTLSFALESIIGLEEGVGNEVLKHVLPAVVSMLRHRIQVMGLTGALQRLNEKTNTVVKLEYPL